MARRQNRVRIWPGRGSWRKSPVAGVNPHYSLRMGKDVLGSPAREVESRPFGQEAETGGREILPPLACQQRVELLLKGVQVEHVRGRIGHLRIAQDLGAPIGELLLLRQFDADEVAHQVLKPVLVRISAGQT